MFRTPQEVAEALYAAVPHALSRAMLEDYGIEATIEQARQITQELLSLNLFWIGCALEAVLPLKPRELVLSELRERILSGWVSDLAWDGLEAGPYFQEAEERRRIYAKAMQEDASPMMIATETATILVADSAVQPEDRNKILALVVDLVPVDELGQLAEQIELVG